MMGRKTCSTQRDDKALESMSSQTVDNGVLNDEVNKNKKIAKRKVAEEKQRKTPSKKGKLAQEELEKTKGATSKAVYQEDQDVVTLQVEQDSDFEEGELVQVTKKNSFEGNQQNLNTSACTISNEAELEQARLYKERELARKKADEEELQVVSKRIAGGTFALVKNMMQESGLLDAASLVKNQMTQGVVVQQTPVIVREQPQQKKRKTGELSQSDSDTTIYERAVKDATVEKSKQVVDQNILDRNNRLSNSSEEGVFDTSDETNGESQQFVLMRQTDDIQSRHVDFTGVPDLSGGPRDGQMPSTSRLTKGPQVDRCDATMRQYMEAHGRRQDLMTPEEKARNLMNEADALKAKKVTTLGKNFELDPDLFKQFHSVMVDDDYLLVAAHVDATTFNEIISGEYVDFARLIPRDHVQQEDDHHLEMIFRGGQAYWVPAGEKDTQAIHSFSKWEQAFRVYSDIYLRRHPGRSTELIQYNHVIYSMSLTYAWDNVYAYDKDFRLHMGRHPERSWGIILQQAWSMRLKDKLFKSDGQLHRVETKSHQDSQVQGSAENGGVAVNRICRRYNKGRCSFGPSCRFEHRCFYCFKFGHSILNCRKLESECHHKDRRSDHRRRDSGDKSQNRDFYDKKETKKQH